ncbi:hypothetical protein C8J56DRAFT_1171030 [Mycena floridula]|nr:hypothetical protein C8J56DRAFT_1171030 [Mycena floridula]
MSISMYNNDSYGSWKPRAPGDPGSPVDEASDMLASSNLSSTTPARNASDFYSRGNSLYGSGPEPDFSFLAGTSAAPRLHADYQARNMPHYRYPGSLSPFRQQDRVQRVQYASSPGYHHNTQFTHSQHQYTTSQMIVPSQNHPFAPTVPSRPVTPPLEISPKRAASTSPSKLRHNGSQTKRTQVEKPVSIPPFVTPEALDSKTKVKTSKSGTATAKPTSKKAGGHGSRNRKPKGEPIDISDDEVMSSRNWSVSDQTALFEVLLGADSDELFEKLKINPKRAFDKVSQSMFEGRFTSDSIKGVYQRSFHTYTFITALMSFTGGAGDQDEHDDEDTIFTKRINAARKDGVPVGGRTVKKYNQWIENGWYELFEARLYFSLRLSNNPLTIYRWGKSAKVTRSIEFNSNGVVSEDEIKSDDSSETPVKEVKPKSKSTVKRSAAATGSEPKHKPSKGFKQGASSSMASLEDFMAVRAETERAKLEVLKERQKSASSSQKLERLERILAMEHISQEVRDEANQQLMKVLLDD